MCQQSQQKIPLPGKDGLGEADILTKDAFGETSNGFMDTKDDIPVNVSKLPSDTFS